MDARRGPRVSDTEGEDNGAGTMGAVIHAETELAVHG